MGKIKSVCQCGTEFEYWPSEKRKFCSLPCAYRWRDIPSYTQFQANKASDFPPITDLQRQLVWGSLLGDGSLEKPPRGVNAYFRESHSEKQKDYLLYKAELLGGLCSKAGQHIRKGQYGLQKQWTRHNEWRLHTHCHPWLTETWQLFYPDGRKVVPDFIFDKLGPFGLAMWYLDDGSAIVTGGGKIATCNFTFDEVEQLAKLLQNKFWIEGLPRKEGKYPIIYITQSGFQRLRSTIREFVPPSMQYKLIHKKGVCPKCGGDCSPKARQCLRCKNMEMAYRYWGIKQNEDSELAQLLFW